MTLDQPVKTSATLVADGVTKISVAAEYYRQMEAASDEAQKESLRARAERMLEQADDDFHVAHDKAVVSTGSLKSLIVNPSKEQSAISIRPFSSYETI